jgi:hypothetical protein
MSDFSEKIVRLTKAVLRGVTCRCAIVAASPWKIPERIAA